MQLVPVEVEDFDDRCIRLIELFGAYSVSKMLHANGAWCMHEFAWRIQRVHGACMDLHGACMSFHGACKGCMANAWSFMSHAWSCMALVKVAGRMHGVACRMQRQSFLVETEC